MARLVQQCGFANGLRHDERIQPRPGPRSEQSLLGLSLRARAYLVGRLITREHRDRRRQNPKIKLQGTLLDDPRIDGGEFVPGSIGRCIEKRTQKGGALKQRVTPPCPFLHPVFLPLPRRLVDCLYHCNNIAELKCPGLVHPPRDPLRRLVIGMARSVVRHQHVLVVHLAQNLRDLVHV